jgi:hypothetical protein
MTQANPQPLTPPQIARIQAVADAIRSILQAEDQTIVMSALAIVSGEAVGSIDIKPPVTRAIAVQLFCQQVSDTAALVEDQRRAANRR